MGEIHDTQHVRITNLSPDVGCSLVIGTTSIALVIVALGVILTARMQALTEAVEALDVCPAECPVEEGTDGP